MNEDRAFNAFLKTKLEEGVIVPPVSLKASLHRPLLMAASLAVVCGLCFWQFTDGRAVSQERCVLQTIEFLEECQAAMRDSQRVGDDAAGSLEDKLLAWQDAPFAEILN